MKDNILKLTQRGIFALFAILVAIQMFPVSLSAAPPRRYGYDDDQNVREMRDSIEFLRHEIENHEAELRMFEERVNTQESTIASLRQQLIDANQSNKDFVRGSASTWDGRIANVESANKGLIADMRQLKSHANDSADALNQNKQKFGELEKIIALQNQNIENLQAALSALTEAMQVKDVAVADSTGSKQYQVKPGDSLEKIARAHNTTVKAIKELNNLPNDRIVVGKTLLIP
jgi:LysM repeat protein